MNRIRVIIIEDSLSVRTYLEHIVSNDPRLMVAASFSTAEDAIQRLMQLAPDVISMDIRLPGMNGFEATLKIMSERPTPIVVFAANVDSDELNISMNALRAGALTVLEKPDAAASDQYESIANRICDQLVLMRDVKVVKQRSSRMITVGPGSSAPSAQARPLRPARSPSDPYRMLGLVASTGGPNALVQVLSKLPANFPLPILLVQHIAPSFLQSFATWLKGLCPFQVEIARLGDVPKAGTIYMAPVDFHIQLESGRIVLANSKPVSMQRPSGTVLFQSMAKYMGRQCIGVLLTGMGDDGAEGLKEIHAAGGYTIAEDESTCVVYGMPAVAVRLGGVSESLPVDMIAERLQQLLQQS